MRIIELPNGEFYLIKSHDRGIGAFNFRASANDTKTAGQIQLDVTAVPAKLMGKRFRIKIEVLDEKRNK